MKICYPIEIHRHFMRHVTVLIVFMFSFLVSSFAYADGCGDLSDNEDWKRNLSEMSELIKEQQYDAALQKAEWLSSVCEPSPMLNYLMALAYRGKDDKAKELFHLQQATRNANAFNVNLEFLERIWRDRMYAENPGMRPENITMNRETIKTLQSDLSSMETEISSMETMIDSADRSKSKIYEAVMWSGTGVGLAGIVMTAVGGTLLGIMKSPLSGRSEDNKVKIDAMYGASWGILGAGIIMTVIGAAAAGVGGAFYVNSQKQNDDTISWHFAPTNIGFTARF